MNITQIRNATLIVEFAGRKFLIDPMLSEMGTQPPFISTPNEHLMNPLVPLPFSVEDLVDVDAVIVTHTHRDHWDDAASQAIPKTMPLFVQHEQDREKIVGDGFQDVRLIDGSVFAGVELLKTRGQHGSDEAIEKLEPRLGEVCGVVFRSPEERTLYLAGDTVWNGFVQEALDEHAPEVVILNCGDAQINGVGSIIMGKHDVAAVCAAAPRARVVATHLEAVNHALLTRAELRDFLTQQGLIEQVSIPLDGERIQA